MQHQVRKDIYFFLYPRGQGALQRGGGIKNTNGGFAEIGTVADCENGVRQVVRLHNDVWEGCACMSSERSLLGELLHELFRPEEM